MRTASGLAMLVAMLLLLGVAGGALKLYMDRESMADMIDGYGQTLTALPVGSDEAAQAFASAAESARAGRFDEAEAQLAQGKAAASRAAQAAPPMMPGMPQLPGIGGNAGQPPSLTPEDVQSALKGLPDDARPFFAKRPELFRRALTISMAARQVAPEAWEPQRAKILKAAAAGDEKKVVELLDEAQQALSLLQAGGAERGGRPGMPGGRGGPGGAGVPAEGLAEGIAQARQMLAQAKSAGMDTGRVSALVDQAARELKGGNPEKAGERLREAFNVAREAMGGGRGGGARGGMGGPREGMGGPRAGMGARRGGGMRGGGRGPGMPPGGPGEGGGPQGMFPGIFNAILGQMQRESGVLMGVMEDIDNAGTAMREKNQDQIREILAAARNKIIVIGQRRDELGQELQAAQAPPEGAGPGGQRPGGQRPGGQRPGGQRPGGQRPGGQRPGGQRPGGGPGAGPSGPFDFQRIHDVIGRALDEARQMPDEEYEQQRDAFIQRFTGRVIGAITGQEFEFSPDQGVSGRGPQSLPPIEVAAEEPTDATARQELEQQVRNRLRMIQEPCAALAQVGADMTPVEAAVSQAREAVNAGKLVEAANATNQAADLVWQLVESRQAELEELRRQTEAQPGGDSPAEQPKQ